MHTAVHNFEAETLVRTLGQLILDLRVGSHFDAFHYQIVAATAAWLQNR
jgi:hypothetical protein